jgi:hypothetical protein
MKMEAAGSSDVFVTLNQTTRHHTPEDSNLQEKFTFKSQINICVEEQGTSVRAVQCYLHLTEVRHKTVLCYICNPFEHTAGFMFMLKMEAVKKMQKGMGSNMCHRISLLNLKRVRRGVRINSRRTEESVKLWEK